VQGQRARLRRGFFTSVSLASVCVFPLMAGLAIGAPEIVVGLLTRKWLPSLPIVQLFCVYGLFAAIYTLGDALARAVGKVYWQFGIHAAFAGSSLVLTAIGAQYGIQYVAAGMIVSVLLIYGLSGGLISHILGTRWITFLRAHVPGVCMALVVGTFAWVAADVARRLELAELVRLVVVVLACGGGLVGAFVLLPRVLLDPLPEFVYENAGARLPGLLRKVIVRKLSLSATGTVGVGK
jgi:O-antigen/teichoic acid export membrane protein